MSTATTLQQAIVAIKVGDKETGKQLLQEVLRADPQNETAWLWMSGVVDSDERRRICLKRVLEINPHSELARRGLASLPVPQPPSTPAVSQQAQSPSLSQAIKATDREVTKKCPYCAETVKAEAIRCRFCGSDLTGQAKPTETLPPGHLPLEQRRKVLDRAVANYMRSGFRLANRTDTTANLVKPKEFSWLILIISLVLILVGGIGLILLIIYLIVYALSRDKTVYLEVDPAGRLFRDGAQIAGSPREISAKKNKRRTSAPTLRKKNPIVTFLAALGLVVLIGLCFFGAFMNTPTPATEVTGGVGQQQAAVPQIAPTATSALTEEDIRSDLEWVLRDYDQASLLGVNIVGRQLVIEVAIDRTSGERFFEALGAIHGAIAEIEPDVDEVTIEDITGQRITVKTSDLIAHYHGQTTFDEFRQTWEIINP